MPPAPGACTPWRLVSCLLLCFSMKCGRGPSIEARRWAGRLRLFWQRMTIVCFCSNCWYVWGLAASEKWFDHFSIGRGRTARLSNPCLLPACILCKLL